MFHYSVVFEKHVINTIYQILLHPKLCYIIRLPWNKQVYTEYSYVLLHVTVLCFCGTRMDLIQLIVVGVFIKVTVQIFKAQL